MKKWSILLCLALLCGCTKGKPVESAEPTKEPVAIKEPVAETAVFTDFLENRVTLYANGNTAYEPQGWDSLSEGTYTESGLRAAVEEKLYTPVQLRYTYITPEDGGTLLVLNYADKEDQWLQWYVIVANTADGLKVALEFQGSGLMMTDVDSEGYVGILMNYDPYGWRYDWLKLSGDGQTELWRSHYRAVGLGANIMAESMNLPETDLPDLKDDQSLILDAIKHGDFIRYWVSNYSDDEQERAREEQLIQYLVENGFAEDEDVSYLIFAGPETEDWVYEEGSEFSPYSSAWGEGNPYATYVEIQEVENGTQGDYTYVLDNGPYTRSLKLTLNYDTLNFRIYDLENAGWSESGVASADGTLFAELSDLPAGTTIVLQFEIKEYNPGTGFELFIEDSEYTGMKSWYIGESGMDGSLYLEWININH